MTAPPRSIRTRKERRRERRAAERHGMTLHQWRAHADDLRQEGRSRRHHRSGDSDEGPDRG